MSMVNKSTISRARYLRLHCCISIMNMTLCGLVDGAEGRTPPGPGAVSDNVGRVGDEWSVVCVELARLV